jgi:hypothetical protein
MIAAADADPWEVVSASDAVLKRLAEARIPASLRDDLALSRATVHGALDRIAESSRQLDPSLPQMVESARAKIDWQMARLVAGYLGKARHKVEREHPEWLRVRYYLAPGDKLQERRLATLEPVAHRGAGVGLDLVDLAEEHAARLEEGLATHVLLEL